MIGQIYPLSKLKVILDIMEATGVRYQIIAYWGKADAIDEEAKPAPVKPEQKQRSTEQAPKMF